MNATLVNALVLTELAKSNSEAKRLIESGGVYINHVQVKDLDYTLSEADVLKKSKLIILRRGKKSYRLVKYVGKLNEEVRWVKA